MKNKNLIQQEIFAKGLNTEIIKKISKIKNEPLWLLNFRLKSYNNWLEMTEPHWAEFQYSAIDYQGISYFARPKFQAPKSLDEVDPEILKTFERLGIPLQEQKMLSGIAVDAVLDSVSVKTTFQTQLKKKGVIFCSFSEAVQKYPDLIQKYLGSVVPTKDNFFACLNSAVFTDGTFVWIPEGVDCPMELSTYFRINAAGTGQFERTLIIANQDSQVSYLEGCTAPSRKENQLHAAVVELVALKNAKIKYSTVQNWFSGSKQGLGGVYNFVTKRGLCQGQNSSISWTQVETGSAITWKYPSVILKGDGSKGEFYSLAFTKNKQKADTGTKMLHLGKNTKSKIISKSLSSGQSQNTYRGKVFIAPKADNSQNYTQCDSLIYNHGCQVVTLPTIDNRSESSKVEHEAFTGMLSQAKINYLHSRGLDTEASIQLLTQGFTRDIIQNLPMEFAVEAKKLIEMQLEGWIG